jgi:hypothetical protein
MTYVPNMIGIPTHGVDLWHHRLRLAKTNPKSPMEPSQGERGEGRKKERERRKEEGQRHLARPVTLNGLA